MAARRGIPFWAVRRVVEIEFRAGRPRRAAPTVRSTVPYESEMNDATLQGAGGGLGAIGYAQFSENVVDVTLDRRFADAK